MERWFHHAESGECRMFNWGGCGGNDNNFSSREKCEGYCGVEKKEKKTEEEEDGDVCHQPVVKGRCKGYFEKFYFDQESGRCEKFVYGGCGGNGNNFASAEECQKKCAAEARKVRMHKKAKQLIQQQ